MSQREIRTRNSRSSAGLSAIALRDVGSMNARLAASSSPINFKVKSRTCESNALGGGVVQPASLQDQVRPFAHPVDRLNGPVEGLEKVRAIDERPLPAAFQIEVVKGASPK